MDTTIGRHISDYWLTALRTLAATRESLRADNSPLPPEMARLHRHAIANFANASIGLTFRDFYHAGGCAVETALANNRAVAVCEAILHTYDGQASREFIVYPADAIPVPPPYIKLTTLTTFYGAKA